MSFDHNIPTSMRINYMTRWLTRYKEELSCESRWPGVQEHLIGGYKESIESLEKWCQRHDGSVEDADLLETQFNELRDQYRSFRKYGYAYSFCKEIVAE